MSHLVVVTGPPGAGKTTVARVLTRMFEPSAMVAGDDFFAFIDQGYIAPWTAEAHQLTGLGTALGQHLHHRVATRTMVVTGFLVLTVSSACLLLLTAQTPSGGPR